MVVSAKITVPTAQLERLGSRAPVAISRALNRAGTSGRAGMVTAISRDMRLKAGTVRERIHLDNATPTKLSVTFYASAQRVPVYDFGAKGPVPSRGRGRGVTAKTPARRYPRAFIATMRSGHVGVFQRVGTSRLPIRELFGPSIAHVFVKHLAVGIARAKESLAKNLGSEIRYEAEVRNSA